MKKIESVLCIKFCKVFSKAYGKTELVMHQSIPAVPIPPPPGNPGAFPNVARPGDGAFAYLGLTPGHLTRGFETVE